MSLNLSFILRKTINIAAICGGSYLAIILASFAIKRFLAITSKFEEKQDLNRRLKTVAPLLNSLIKYIVVFFAIILLLREFGVDATAILAGAGIVGIAIGFGAQTLVKDILTGVFLLVEDSISVGDIVQIGDLIGTVEDIGLRVTRIRPFSGALVIIPNGEITRIANFNRGFTRAIVEVGIAYEEDVDRAVQVLQNIASQYRRENPSKILEEPTIHRIARLDSSAVILRVILKVAPKEHWGVERDLLYLIKKTFDEEKIEIPYQKHVVFLKDLR